MTIRQDIETYRRGLAGLRGTVADDLDAPTLGDMLAAGERCAAAVEPLLAATGNPIGEATAAAQEIRTLQEENARLRRYVGLVLKAQDWTHDVDGGDLQDWMVEAGVLAPTRMQAPCGEWCRCDQIGADFPATCYRVTELGRACQQAAAS